MKAIVCRQFGDYHDLKIEDIDPPALAPLSVRIAIEYASVTFATSLWIAGKYQHKPTLPFVPGTEITGTVMETGAGVATCKAGDRVLAVLGWGGFAEQAVVPAHTVYRLPDNLPLDQGLHLGISYITAFGGLHWRAALKSDETLLVLAAAGAVGLAAVEIGKAMGARVLGAAGGTKKCAVVTAHGADAAIDYSTVKLREEIDRLTEGRGVDVVFDPVGGSQSDAAMRSLVPGGRHVIIGFASGNIPQIPANVLLVKNISVLGLNVGTYVGWATNDQRARYEPMMRAAFQKIFAWHVEGKLQPMMSEAFPLEAYAEAQDAILARRSIGKVALKINA